MKSKYDNSKIMKFYDMKWINMKKKYINIYAMKEIIPIILRINIRISFEYY